MYECRWAVTQKLTCYKFCIDFYKQLKAIVIAIVIGKIECNCNLIVIGINVIDPCLGQGNLYVVPSGFISRSSYTNLQVSVCTLCSGYDLCQPG